MPAAQQWADRSPDKVNIWLVTVGEPVPMDAARGRLLRTGIMAGMLADAGHQVTWWTSSLDHVLKRKRQFRNCAIEVSPGYRIWFLDSIAYSRNISIARIVNHVGVARQFRRAAPREPEPDIILCSFPTIELSVACVEYGRDRGIPVILDVRDLWPDVFRDALPKAFQPVLALPVAWMESQVRRAFRQCSAVVGISDNYLKWGLEKTLRGRQSWDAVFPLGHQEAELGEGQRRKAESELVSMGVDPGRFICWFVGIFGRTYDLLPVLAAAREVQAQAGSQIQFVLSGDGDNFDSWNRAAGGLPNVVFTGWLDVPKLEVLKGWSRLGLAAYLAGAPQGLPNKVFEYLAAGLPVVSSLRGETESLLAREACGETYDPSRPEGLAGIILALHHEEARREAMASRAREVFDSRFSAEKVYSAMIRYLEDVAGQRSRLRDSP